MIKNQSVLNSPRLIELRRKRKKAFKRKIIFFVFLFLFFLIGLSFVFKIDKFNIETVSIQGNKVIDSEEIQKIAQKNLAGYYLFLYPKSNFLIYPRRKIEKEINFNLKRIKEISFNIKNFKTLDIEINEYEGKYLWCGLVIPILNTDLDQKCYFLDEYGYIFDEAPYFSGDVYFKFYGDIDDKKNNPSGTYYLSQKFKSIISLKNNLEKMDLKPTSFYFEDSNQVNISLSSEPFMGPRIIFKKDANYEKIAENLQAVLATDSFKEKFQKNFYSLEYLDLRFGNKVFYKFK